MAELIEVVFDDSETSDVIDLKGLDIVGLWDKEGDIDGSAFEVSTSDERAGDDKTDCATFADAATVATIPIDEGFILIPASTFAGLLRFVWLTSTDSEDATIYLVCRRFH